MQSLYKKYDSEDGFCDDEFVIIVFGQWLVAGSVQNHRLH